MFDILAGFTTLIQYKNKTEFSDIRYGYTSFKLRHEVAKQTVAYRQPPLSNLLFRQYSLPRHATGVIWWSEALGTI